MATLLQICTDAIEGVDSFSAPSSIIGNNDAGAVLLKSFATQCAKELVRSHKWRALKTPYSFTTTASVSSYAVPADLGSFANMTFWSGTVGFPMTPVDDVTWRAFESGASLSGLTRYFQFYGGQLQIRPIPQAAETITFDYYSKYFCTSSTGTAQENWQSDTDLFRLDDDLLTLGIRYRFLSRKGLPNAEEKADYLSARNDLIADETPKGIINVGGKNSFYGYRNIPETGFGT